MIKVAITDDHEMVLTGLQQMLSESGRIQLCGLYMNAAQLREGLKQQVPDVLLLDLKLPDVAGDKLAEEVLQQYPSVKILILTSSDVTFRVKKMMQMGCKGYSLKNVSQKVLIDAIESIYNGQDYLDPVIKEDLLRETLGQKTVNTSTVMDITRREKEILNMLAGGDSSKDIAQKLYISARTVDNHRKSLLNKFEVKNTTGLIKAARDLGII